MLQFLGQLVMLVWQKMGRLLTLVRALARWKYILLTLYFHRNTHCRHYFHQDAVIWGVLFVCLSFDVKLAIKKIVCCWVGCSFRSLSMIRAMWLFLCSTVQKQECGWASLALTFPVSLVFTGYLLCALVTDQHLSFLLPYVVLGSHVGLASDVGSGAHDIW